MVTVKSMLVIGIAGGIASGKSLVASMFCRLGAMRLDADEIGHQVLELADVKQAIQQAWGDSVFQNQQVDLYRSSVLSCHRCH